MKLSMPTKSSVEKAREIMSKVPRAGTFRISRKEMIIESIATALDEAIETQVRRDAEIAKEHHESHCCEDCPCDYWRENTSEAILNQLLPPAWEEKEK